MARLNSFSIIRAFPELALTGAFLFSGAAFAAGPGVTKDLTTLFPASDAAMLGGFSSTNVLTSDAGYKSMMNLCRGYSNDPSCAGLSAFGVVNRPNAPDSIRGMNQMVVIGPSGNKRYVNVLVTAGKLTYDPALVRENEIGYIDLTYYQGSIATPFVRCDAEVVVCGSKVVGCPQAAKAPSCSPTVSTVATSTNCTCPGGQVLTACIGNVPSCYTQPPATITCAVDEVADGQVCKRKWSCSSSDLTPTEQQSVTDACTTTTVTLDRTASGSYYPSILYCSGQKSCPAAECAEGNMFESDGKTCTPCGAGTYSNTKNSTFCPACPVGSIAAQPGSKACTKCPAGQYSSNGTTCSPCAPGTYASSDGSGSCTACANPTGVAGALTFNPPGGPAGATAASQCTYSIASCNTGWDVAADKQSCNLHADKPMLIYGKHSYSDCTDMGGTVVQVDVGGTNAAVCKFSVNGSITGRLPGTSDPMTTVDICRYKTGTFLDGSTGPMLDRSYSGPNMSADPVNAPTYSDYWYIGCTPTYGASWTNRCPRLNWSGGKKNDIWSNYQNWGNWVLKKSLSVGVMVIHGASNCVAQDSRAKTPCPPNYIGGAVGTPYCYYAPDSSLGWGNNAVSGMTHVTETKWEYKEVLTGPPDGCSPDFNGCCYGNRGYNCEMRCVETTYSRTEGDYDDVACY